MEIIKFSRVSRLFDAIGQLVSSPREMYKVDTLVIAQSLSIKSSFNTKKELKQ